MKRCPYCSEEVRDERATCPYCGERFATGPAVGAGTGAAAPVAPGPGRGASVSAPGQARVDRLLRRGILFSYLWLMGVGSAIAVVSALQARRSIRESGGALRGTFRVWWCLVLGSFGLVVWVPLVVVGLLNQLR